MHYCIKTGEIQQIDYPVSAPKKTLWFSAKIAPIQDLDKDIKGTSIVIRDITEQVDMEKTLEQTEEKYHYHKIRKDNGDEKIYSTFIREIHPAL